MVQLSGTLRPNLRAKRRYIIRQTVQRPTPCQNQQGTRWQFGPNLIQYFIPYQRWEIVLSISLILCLGSTAIREQIQEAVKQLISLGTSVAIAFLLLHLSPTMSTRDNTPADSGLSSAMASFPPIDPPANPMGEWREPDPDPETSSIDGIEPASQSHRQARGRQEQAS